VSSRKLTIDSPLIACALLFAGVVAAAAAWRDRHPHTTSDFTLFYVSAQQTTAAMFDKPPGPPRGNMNPPLFQLMLRPLTLYPLPVAAAIFRAANIVALIGCIWWIARTSEERWTAADYGALLAWAPMASVISLNQLTWLLWPPLVWAWWCWRRERWTAGAIGYGLVLSLKPFVGVVLLWLLVAKQWRAAAASVAAAAAAAMIGVAAYGPAVTRAWVEALGDVTWAYAAMNASVQGVLARALAMSTPSSTPLIQAPALVAPLAGLAGALIVLATLVHTRRRAIDEAWLPLLTSALLASPLGWIYYIWWVLPAARPSRLLLESPLLWMPMGLTILFPAAPWQTITFGSIYFWGLFVLWLNRVWFARVARGLAPAYSAVGLQDQSATVK
jgi:hypothetical protein